MSRALIVRPEAESDMEEVQAWYDQQRTGLGADFLLCVEETLDRIVRNPEMYGILHRDIRRAFVRRFPYGVFYRIVEDQVIVVGVFHGRRNPRTWKSRR